MTLVILLVSVCGVRPGGQRLANHSIECRLINTSIINMKSYMFTDFFVWGSTLGRPRISRQMRVTFCMSYNESAPQEFAMVAETGYGVGLWGEGV